jgi:hypothetical protein
LNLHQCELIVDAKGKKISIAIQNCEPIREEAFDRHISWIENLINDSSEYSITMKKNEKIRNAQHHRSLVDELSKISNRI